MQERDPNKRALTILSPFCKKAIKQNEYYKINSLVDFLHCEIQCPLTECEIYLWIYCRL